MAKNRSPIDDTLRRAMMNYLPSITALSKETGVPQSTLHRFLKDGRNFRIDNAEKVCAVLGLELTPTKQPPKKGKE